MKKYYFLTLLGVFAFIIFFFLLLGRQKPAPQNNSGTGTQNRLSDLGQENQNNRGLTREDYVGEPQNQQNQENPQTPEKQSDTMDSMENTQIKQYSEPPEMMINEDTQYTAVLKTTEGDITFLLNTGITPITANNFIFLAKDGFYDNTIFHRVVSGFMIQGGDPTGTGAGGPGYRFDDEEVVGNYARGTVAMANAGPNTNGSQFFIMQGDKPLDPNYVIFGYVTAGLDIVDKIATAPVTSQPTGEQSKPLTPVKILSVEIIENT